MSEDCVVSLGNSQEYGAFGFRKGGNSIEGGLAWDKEPENILSYRRKMLILGQK